MVQVINFYSIVCLLIGALLWFVLDETSEAGIEQDGSSDETVAVTLKETAHDLFSLLLNLRVWLVAFCILTGYQVFWATYTSRHFSKRSLVWMRWQWLP